MRSLPELQSAIFLAITAADGNPEAGAASAVAREIRGDGHLAPEERIAIYARMYGARLVDALTEDYPRVRATVGDDRFRTLALAYVARHPSRHPSLRWLGARFADDLAFMGASPAFLADLARLEWARVMAFDAPDVPVLSVDALTRLPPEAWADLRLRCIPSLEMLALAWPADRIWEEAETARPDGLVWARGAFWIRVWRQEDRVYQAPVDAVERAALETIRAGGTFGAMCEAVAAAVLADEAPATAAALVLRWIADGVLAADAAA